MCYLHQTVVASHGHLRSSNCLVDNRWVVKISSYGLSCLRRNEAAPSSAADEYVYYKKLLWTAPELLRQPTMPLKGSQKGDVFSFGIILQEILFHASPYFATDLTPKGEYFIFPTATIYLTPNGTHFNAYLFYIWSSPKVEHLNTSIFCIANLVPNGNYMKISKMSCQFLFLLNHSYLSQKQVSNNISIFYL